MAEQMQAVLKAEAAPGAEMRRAVIPRPGPKDVLIKVKASSICGTDLHIYDWDHWAQGRIHPPRIFGHEFAGEVVDVGSDVTLSAVGDYVSGETHIVCGHCLQCRTGQQHICQNLAILGVDVDGSFADYVCLPEGNAWVNDPSLPLEAASIQEAMGNAVHTVFSGEVAAKTVLVTGCGPIGLCAIGVALAAGADAVYAADVNRFRLNIARQVGATEVFNSAEIDLVAALRQRTGGRGADVLLEMSGQAKAIQQGIAALRSGGRASLLGIPSDPVTLDLANEVILKNVRLDGIAGREMYGTWYQCASFLKRVNIAPIVTHHLKLSEFDKAFALLHSGQCGKIVMYP